MSVLFSSPLQELAAYQELEEALKKGKGPLQVSGCLDTQKVHLIHELLPEYSHRLIVTYNELRARELAEDYRFFDREVQLFPAKDVLFYSADVQGTAISAKRMQAIKHLLEEKQTVIVTTVDGLMNLLPPLSVFRKNLIQMEVGAEFDLEALKQQLVDLGYEREGIVSQAGQFAIHGGILDIYPLTEETPFRIEFWDREVDSIRSFDLESQRSIEQVEQLVIYPASELLVEQEKVAQAVALLRKDGEAARTAFLREGKKEEASRIRAVAGELAEQFEERLSMTGLESCMPYFYEQPSSILDYLPLEQTLIFLDEPERMKERGEEVETEFRESMSHRLEKGYVLSGQAQILRSFKTVAVQLDRPRTVTVTSLEQHISMMKIRQMFTLMVQGVNAYQSDVNLLIHELETYKKQEYRVVMLCASRLRGERLAAALRSYELRAFYSEEYGRYIQPGEILVTYGTLHRGFSYPQARFAVLAEEDLFGREKKKHKYHSQNQFKGTQIKSFQELTPGDYVVHENHGLGIYRGIEKVEVEKTIRDFMRIEYGDGGNLFIPATQFHLIQKYADAEAKKPKLSKLGSPEWSKTKSRVRAAVQDVARDLVELYAARQGGKGFCYGPDTVWQKEFEELFPYEETEDQLAAIAATKQDMESDKIMDRLVCGDVGFGKTEVAIRAAFKAVQENKQVVYLVPTTILAQQHYNTFCQRMKDYPVNIALMSRFRTPAQNKAVAADLKKGLLDIVIGTHRVLSKDVAFRDLGLLIIDEEQRFGVRHKEKIKQMKQNVDVLTLTATPIPRTLHMSLIGIRDMSMLEEAPIDRLPIQTYVMEWNPETVREAIHRELARNGQVYYVYNRVTDIDEMSAKIAALVPDATVAFAHGQMSERELEKVMMGFLNQEIDVLVTTTIIETGLDISNVNTIIIHDADRFGLSQLYQLKGRVGRSNRLAYAFIMYRRDKMLKEVAEKRLRAIKEYSELGSGVRIAMKDLELRGAGNLLGAEQSGQMEAVGYDLYCKMLGEAVAALKGEESTVPSFETTIDLKVDAYIPASYVRSETARLDLYKRIATIESEEEEMDLQDELIDRFGDIPVAVQQLITIASLKKLAHEAYMTEVTGGLSSLKFVMYQKAPVDGDRMLALIDNYKGELRFLTDHGPYFQYEPFKKGKNDKENLLLFVKNMINEIKMLLVL